MTEYEINVQIVLRLEMISHVSSSHIMCHCPYHVDRNPSCSVDIENGLWHCFSCGQGGKLRSLFRDIKGHSINKELNIPWEKQTSFVNPFRIEEAEDFSTPETHIALSGTFIGVDKNKDVVSYLNKRKIPLNVAKSMKMLFAVSAKSYDTLDEKNEKEWVFFNHRLLIPIYENNKLLSCEGRDIYGEKAFKSKMIELGKPEVIYKKCLYPRGSSTSTLFELEKLDDKKRLYFVEGIMDLAVLRSDPFFDSTNSTAIFGASITRRQVELLKHFDFTFIIDNDLAGWLSLRRLASQLKDVKVKKSWKFVTAPFRELGVKDVGDVPVKSGHSIKSVREAHWLDNEKNIFESEDLINIEIAKLQKEKDKCEQH